MGLIHSDGNKGGYCICTGYLLVCIHCKFKPMCNVYATERSDTHTFFSLMSSQIKYNVSATTCMLTPK